MSIAKAFSIVTASLPDGEEKQSYALNLSADGGTPRYGWSASGLPIPEPLHKREYFR